tara:strand:+ start:71 stop:202 length:132 start_codon:yes stop_codon:yes gene_type:complete
MAIYKQIEQEDVINRKASSITTDQKDKMEAIVTAFITHLKAAL